MEEYELYERYAGLCVDEETYDLLEDKGIIDKGLKNLFDFKYEVSRDYSGSIIQKIASYGQNLYLEDWYGSIRESSECAFFYKDFMVICKMPEMGYGKVNNGNFVKPVAIPLKQIKRIEFVEKESRHRIGWLYDYYIDYGIKIYFINDIWFEAILFAKLEKYKKTGKQCDAYLHKVNWSFETNQLLLRKPIWPDFRQFQIYSGACEENLMLITSRIYSLINNCTDFLGRELSIKNYNLDSKDVLFKNLYESNRDFTKALITILPELKEKCSNQNLISSLEEIKEFEKNNLNEIDEIEKEINKLKQELVQNSGKSNFLDKIKFVSKEKKLKNDIETLNNKLLALLAPKEIISKAIKEFLSDINNVDIDIEYERIACDIYEECEKRNLISVNTDEQIILYDMVCKQFGVNKNNFPFEYCKEIFNKNDAIKDYIENIYDIKSDRYVAIRMNNKRRKKAEIIGIEKYTTKIEEKIKKLSKEEKELEKERKDYYADEEYRNKCNEKLTELRNEIKTLENLLNSINSRLCDTEHTEIYYKYLNCEVKKYNINEYGYMDLDVEVSFTKPLKLNNMDIIIDGAIIIDIISENEKVGEVCLVGKEIDLYRGRLSFNFGFGTYNGIKSSLIGVPFKDSFDNEKMYTFKFSPLNIWMIEN